MKRLVAIAALISLSLLTIFQILLIFGVPLGHMAWGGKNEVLPVGFRIASIISIAIYAFIAAVIIDKSKMSSVFKNKRFSSVAIKILSLYFFIGVLMNLASTSASERIVMAPAALLMAVCCAYLSISK